jgi:nicotinate-nucleotide adenylyltransferase
MSETGPVARTAPLAILGGTFDPLHDGHIGLAEDVARGLRLDSVVLMPTGDPPHRAPPGASAPHRVAMVGAGIEGHSRLALDTREAVRTGKSYTVDTLQELRTEHPRRPLAVIVGADAFLGLPSWHRWKELFDLAHVIVVARPGVVLDASHLPGALRAPWDARFSADAAALRARVAGAIVQQSITPRDISASAIRAQLARGEPGARAVSGLLPPAVLAYIRRHRLYGYRPDAT